MQKISVSPIGPLPLATSHVYPSWVEKFELVDFYASRDAAEGELAEILHDEPDWAGRFEIVLVDFSGADPTVSTR